jgi:hypothetical protein
VLRRTYGQVQVDAACKLLLRRLRQRPRCATFVAAVAGRAAAGLRRAAGACRVVRATRSWRSRRGGRGSLVELAVRLGVDAAGEQLTPDVRVPVVLDLVVRPPRQPSGDQRPPV